MSRLIYKVSYVYMVGMSMGEVQRARARLKKVTPECMGDGDKKRGHPNENQSLHKRKNNGCGKEKAVKKKRKK